MVNWESLIEIESIDGFRIYWEVELVVWVGGLEVGS